VLFVVIMSYNGGINFGLLVDYDVIDDVVEVVCGIEDLTVELFEVVDVVD